MNGAELRQQMIDGGAPATKVQEWERGLRAKMLAGGAPPEEVSKYWGDPPPADPARLNAMINGNLDTLNPDQKAKVAESWDEFFYAGLQSSSTGLLTGRPTTQAPPDMNLAEKLIMGAGGMVGDLPANIVGGVAGGIVGSGAGPVGTITGFGAGGAYLPAVIRETMMHYYENEGGPKTWKEFWEMTAEVQWGAAKEAAAGGAGMVAGAKAGTVVGKAASPLLGQTGAKIVGGGANATTFAVTATGVHAALEGEIPGADDFLAGAILALGLHGAGTIVGAAGRFIPNDRAKRVAQNLRDMYSATGVHPRSIVRSARGDTVLQGEILAPRDAEGNRVQPTVDAMRPQEPENPNPYKPEINKTNVDKTLEAAVEDGVAPDVNVRPSTIDDFLAMIDVLERSDAAAARLGINVDSVISPAGAVGRYQIMPDTARQYGYDPHLLFEPEYNKMVAKTILADLSRRYNGDPALVAIAYNGGPGRANAYIRAGRDPSVLPRETQDYLRRAEIIGQADEGLVWRSIDAQIALQGGGGGSWVPPNDRWFNSVFGEDPPPKNAVGRYDDTIRMSEDMMIERTLDMVADNTRNWPDYLSPKKLKAMFDMQLVAARELDKIIGTKPDQYGIEDMMRNTYASRERAGAFVRYGTVDPITLTFTSDNSMIKAFQQVQKDGGTLAGFEAYRLNARTMEKAAQGIKTGFDLELAKRYVSTPGIQKKYAKAMKIMRAVKDASIDYAVDSGRYSKTQGEAMKRLNREHIVMRRVIDPTYEPPTAMFGRRRGLKKMKGSDRQIVDPYLADLDNLHTIIATADFNRAVGAVISAIEAHNAKAPDHLKIPSPERIGEIAIESKIKEGELLDEMGNPLPKEAQEAAAIFLAERQAQKHLGPDKFIYYREGKLEIWQAKDPDLAQLLSKVWPGKVNPFAEFAIALAGIVRLGVTASFDFPLRTTFQAMIGASVMGKETSRVPFLDPTRGVAEVFKKGDLYKEWMIKGGAGTALTDMDVNYVQRDLAAVFEKTGASNKVWNVVSHPIEMMRTLNHNVDAAARVGMYKRLTEKGMSPEKAAMRARKDYLDYGEPFAHKWVQTWSRMAAFMAPGWKDIEQFGQRFSEGAKVAGKVGMYGAAIMTVPTIVNYALNWAADQNLPEGQRYIDRPRWERDMYWVTPPLWGGERLKLKRPFLPAVPFTTMPERFLMWLRENDPHFEDLMNSILAMAVPPMMPNVFIPTAEDWANKSFMTGRPLIPAYLEEATEYMQYRPDTSETAKAISKLLGPMNLNIKDASPIILENYFRQWAGTLPMTILKTLEQPFKDPGRPKTWADTPFLGAFFVRHQVGGQQVDDFYTRLEDVKAAKADLRLAIDRQDFSQIEGTMTSESALKLTRITKALSNMRAVVQAINLADMTDDEKLKRTDQIAVGMVKAAESGLAVLHALDNPPSTE